MEIIEEEIKEYCLVYEDIHGDGYSFPCDAKGHILWDECPYPDTTKKSLAYCKARQDWAKNGDVVTIVSRERYGICPHCGNRVYFGGSGWAACTTECDCGQWYNVLGQQIKPPEDWYDDRDDDWQDDLYNDWQDDSYKYHWYEGYTEG